MAHPGWNPHIFQGWATNLIPRLISNAKHERGFNMVALVKGKDAIQTSQRLAHEENIFRSICYSGVLSAAPKFAETAAPGTNMFAVITNTGEQYQSTRPFDNIPTEMMVEEENKSTIGNALPPPLGMSGFFPSITDEFFIL